MIQDGFIPVSECFSFVRTMTRELLNFARDAKVFVFVSTGHYRRKGFFLAVQALAAILRHALIPSARLLVDGRTAANRDWKRCGSFSSPQHIVTDAGLDPARSPASVPDVEKLLRPLHAAADGFLFPSYSRKLSPWWKWRLQLAACLSFSPVIMGLR